MIIFGPSKVIARYSQYISLVGHHGDLANRVVIAICEVHRGHTLALNEDFIGPWGVPPRSLLFVKLLSELGSLFDQEVFDKRAVVRAAHDIQRVLRVFILNKKVPIVWILFQEFYLILVFAWT